MIQTFAKSKIPSFLAYSVNAKAITEALGEIPQASELRIWFHYSKPPESPSLPESYRVLSVDYSFFATSRFLPRSADNEPQWTLTVNAVQRANKHRISELLISEALPKMRLWLISKGQVTGEREYHRWAVAYNEAMDRLEYELFSRP